MSRSASAQISESKPVRPASKIPTTRQSLKPNRRVWPKPVPLNRLAMLPPIRISELPGLMKRPELSLTWGRRRREISVMPRMETFPVALVPALGRAIRTMTSRAARGFPSVSWAISGWVSMTAASERCTMLTTSLSADRRTTTTLSGDPVSTRVFFNPSASMRTAAKTKTTRAMPAAVRKVVSLRVQRLRKL